MTSTLAGVTEIDLSNHGIRGGAAAALAELKSLRRLYLGAGLTADCLPRLLRRAVRSGSLATDLDGQQGRCAQVGRPRNVTSTATTASSVSLSWDAPTGAGTVVGYRIKRRPVSRVDLVTIEYDTGSTATAYVDRSVGPGTHYIYRVVPLNVVGEEGVPAHRFEVTTPR